MKMKRTMVANFVGAALSVTALGSVAANFNQAYGLDAPAKVKMPVNTFAKKQNQQPTINGMRNQYDAQLGTNTFQWASKGTSAPNVRALSVQHQNEYAADYYMKQLTGLKDADTSLAKPVLAQIHDLGRGAKIAKYKQEIAGVEVFNREYNIMMDRNFNLVASSGYFVNSHVAKSAASSLKNAQAEFGSSITSINAVFADMGGDSNSVTLTAKSDIKGDKYERFSVTNTAKDKIILGEPRAKKVFFEHKNKLVSAHYVEVETGDIDSRDSEMYGYVVSAATGEVLFKKNLSSHAADFSYRVYAEENGKPWDGPHGNVMPAPAGSDPAAFLTADYMDAPMVSLAHGPISTMDPWLADDATMTKGNNVTAYVDAIAPQGFTNGDYMAEITSANTFDYKYNEDEAEYSLNNRKAAIVNLFYLANYLHDDYYDHGFDEAAGNAQELNYDRGGVEGDALNVEVQDNSGFNNANMSTPADGGSPRMQMYLWETTQAVNGVDYGVTVSSHAELGSLAHVGFAGFGPAVFDITGTLVRLDDGTETVNDGCEPAINGADIAGKIAVIDRGSCAFVDKVMHAQEVGAIGVIIANNKDGDDVITMGGENPDITIPSMMVSQNAGADIYALLDADETVSVKLFKNDLSRVFKDSSWDNAIVAHEWGHYISNRLVGNGAGLSSVQARSMGEGFGDFHALLLASDEADNQVAGNENYAGGYGAITYVSSFVNGIRPYPYSTDMEINPSTFEDIGLYPEEVHAPGSIWGNMLWESFVAMANDERHTFAEAKSLMKDYLVAGYKMMPMAPTFTEGRDAILAAAYANDPEDYKLMLAAFAKRGMGLGAESPARNAVDHAGAIESYKTELDTYAVTSHMLDTNYEGLTSGYCTNDNILDKGETGTVSFSVKNAGSSALTGLTGTVVVESGHDVTFANEGKVTIGDVAMFDTATSAPIEFTLNESGTGDQLVLKFVPDLEDGMVAEEYMLATVTNIDFEERELVGTSQTDDFNSYSRLNDYAENIIIGGDMAKGTWGLDQWDATDGMIAATGNSFTSDVAYQTRPMSVGYDGEYTISFWHLYNIESGYDGAVVEVRVNGGDWADVTEMGGQFLGDGYTETGLEETEAAIADRAMFSGVNYGWETINFGESLNGNQVEFRFRIATDSAYVPEPVFGFASGWYIDDMTFTNIQTSILSDVIAGDSVACDNRLPYVDVAVSEQTVTEGSSVTLSVEASDPNGDELTYTWAETSTSGVALTGSDTAELSFTAPQVSAATTLEFSVTVSDGTDSVVKTATVTVNDVPAPVEPAKKSSGGSTGWLALLLLPLAALRRRK
ncbi:rhombosortase-dependent M36 family metallopeptidase [Litorilituus sediminis]|uniref:GlyGly-CTERM sorting domain-containing protein n=1 Tax=Litorilituus sediminis TaxID=718192 RepID=A0A4P6P7H2_9GAMM|nr:rhombosortase-dependent M36 family metallopeptidase [Litorilituus sediminis]QBG35357.1 GlyGly-CTERM sorting domain-containing protein [Litorilituus sediminis]